MQESGFNSTTEASECSSRPLTAKVCIHVIIINFLLCLFLSFQQGATSQSVFVTRKYSDQSQQDHDQPIPKTSTDIESSSKAFATPYSKTGDLH